MMIKLTTTQINKLGAKLIQIINPKELNIEIICDKKHSYYWLLFIIRFQKNGERRTYNQQMLIEQYLSHHSNFIDMVIDTLCTDFECKFVHK